jgi:hypothetical protein
MINLITKPLSILVLISFLAACGGGGSENIEKEGIDNNPSIEIPDENIPDDSVSEEPILPPQLAPSITLTFEAIKLFRFSWSDIEDATFYQLLENADGLSGFTPVGETVNAGIETLALDVPLYARTNAQYIVQACNNAGCIDSETIFVSDNLVGSIGYIKASNTGNSDFFGSSISLSGDGLTLVVAAPLEDSGDANDPTDDSTENSGAVYVFIRTSTGSWVQQAYLKADSITETDQFGISVSISSNGDALAIGAINDDTGSSNSGAVHFFNRNTQGQWTHTDLIKAELTGSDDKFGTTVSLSADGKTLAVGAPFEDSNSLIDTDNNEATDTGAVYIFNLQEAGEIQNWVQSAYLKASNISDEDRFGDAINLSGNGATLVVGVSKEDSNDVNTPENNDAESAGAVYVFALNSDNIWQQQAYLKASNLEAADAFGISVAVNHDGTILAAGARFESSNTTEINGDETNNSANRAGAAYVFTLDDTNNWNQEAYIKPNNTLAKSTFGFSLDLNHEGDFLAVTANLEESSSIGVNGDSNSNSSGAGAAYTFTRNLAGQWTQQAFIKSSNTANGDQFGIAISIDDEASVLAVGARNEDSSTTGINGDQGDNSIENSGAAYLY